MHVQADTMAEAMAEMNTVPGLLEHGTGYGIGVRTGGRTALHGDDGWSWAAMTRS